MQHNVSERLDKECCRHYHHKPEQYLVRARGKLDSLHGHDRDQSHRDRRQKPEGQARHHALNCQYGVKGVLNRLKKILEKHRPSHDETNVRIHSAADVRIDGARRWIHSCHPAKADRRHGHGHHCQKHGHSRMSARENLGFAKKRNRRDR